MTIYDVPNLTGGIDDVLVDIAGAEVTFIPMFLLFVFVIIFIGGAFRQKDRAGTADMPMWSTLASITVLMISLILAIIPGLIQLETLVIVISITIASGLWLYITKGRGEI